MIFFFGRVKPISFFLLAKETQTKENTLKIGNLIQLEESIYILITIEYCYVQDMIADTLNFKILSEIVLFFKQLKGFCFFF